MIKPLGVLLVLCVVLVLLLFLVIAVLWMVHCIRHGKRNKATALGIASASLAVFCAFATYAVAPKGGRTIAQLQLPGNREFILRHYRYGWFEYPKARFYARDAKGVWTSFALISELINPINASLILDTSKQEISVGKAGWYRVDKDDLIFEDGGRGKTWQLLPGIEPSDDNIYENAAPSTSVLIRRDE